MSDPKRFDPLSDGMWENSAGDYVLYADYAALQAEVERLRKAGDAMVLKIPDMVACKVTAEEAVGLMNDWIEAKEGKPKS